MKFCKRKTGNIFEYTMFADIQPFLNTISTNIYTRSYNLLHFVERKLCTYYLVYIHTVGVY